MVRNFVAGLILMFERPIQRGDTVDVAELTGTVRDIGLRATTISTFDGADVIVPNGLLLADTRIRQDYLRFAATLGLRDVRFIPISALAGDMVVERGDRLPWYKGPTLM